MAAHQHKVWYQAASSKGDSGAPLITRDGAIVAVHQEGLTNALDLPDPYDLKAVHDSLKSLISSPAQAGFRVSFADPLLRADATGFLSSLSLNINRGKYQIHMPIAELRTGFHIP